MLQRLASEYYSHTFYLQNVPICVSDFYLVGVGSSRKPLENVARRRITNTDEFKRDYSSLTKTFISRSRHVHENTYH